MDFIKKQSVSTWISLTTLILAVVGIIIYGVNVTAEGRFQNAGSGLVVAFAVFAIIALAAVIVGAQFKFDGLVGKIVKTVSDALKIVVPMFLMIALLAFVTVRVEGLAYIFGSNPEILATIQTPANLGSAYTAVAGFIFFGIAWLGAAVAAFLGLTKKTVSAD